ncbi:MAG TPA: hypothetical protein PLN55_13240 [Burkholderiaceae bacterium]|nr:hypothetical protein [Burkholderiaceae bacterium]HPE02589.1 hypothetical protein [Burkholderiaceae bacterium]
MRRDVVTEVFVQFDDGVENFATRFEAERFLDSCGDEPRAAWLEDAQGRVRARYRITRTPGGGVALLDVDADAADADAAH